MTALARAFTIDDRSLAALRIGLAVCVLCELADRWPLLDAFYSDEGIHPTTDLADWPRALCVHALFGSAAWVRALSVAHGACAAAMLLGAGTRIVAPLTWYLYASLTLRNCSVAYIADRYLHFFLLLVACTPCARVWSVDAARAEGVRCTPRATLSLATALLRLQLVWIYADAGAGKLLDAEGAWRFSPPDGVAPALDTMVRHTAGGRVLRTALGRDGLRLLGASVAWLELLAPLIALVAAATGRPRTQLCAGGALCAMHAGIALTMNNSVLLGLVACVAWLAYAPAELWGGRNATTEPPTPRAAPRTAGHTAGVSVHTWVLLPAALAVCAYNARTSECDVRASSGIERLQSALLHNRWNVFVSGEDHVTWFVAPARLASGRVVDLWARGASLDWSVPARAPRTGRWKSFAALAFAGDGEPDRAKPLWDFLCAEWNGAASREPTERALYYKFWLLSAPLDTDSAEGNAPYGEPRKRLLRSHTCS
eukprot:CAMPEP_0119409828 /NCGR_PEP_ID=MMETSP1335-20130426/3013_1 /TAXON_ID=259385 /ORGANISM="Chrysoculter rhomboideus, Strain RCC1486" /LENGTH=483 /DNA_ID=CAMNT_0007434263 /DNA_START=8 /DNA_END=1459 /DNA_ORIENTATION=-